MKSPLLSRLRITLTMGLTLFAGLMLVSGCGTPSIAPEAPPLGDDPVLLFIAQEADGIHGYVESGAFPTPGGVVEYSNVYNTDGHERLRTALAQHPRSVGMLGLYMVEGADFPDGFTGVIEGRFDPQIDQLGAIINEAARPVLVRIGYEFDGFWNHYDPVNRLRAQSPYFVSVWHSAASPLDAFLDREHRGVEAEDFRVWYPGNAYVDWVGVSWFMSHLPMQRTLAQKMADFGRRLAPARQEWLC